jgi:hypothetical protein
LSDSCCVEVFGYFYVYNSQFNRKMEDPQERGNERYDSDGNRALSIKEFDENDDLLSDYTSDTTFFDNERTSTVIEHNPDQWSFNYYRSDGKVHILGEWIAKSKAYRYVVIGPDWPCVVMTYIAIIVPSVLVYVYLAFTLAEQIVFYVLFSICLFGLTAVFLADPGLVRKYHHARSRHWTYCDHCESFRPPGTVHCSTCQVCVAEYDHHCPVRGFVMSCGTKIVI